MPPGTALPPGRGTELLYLTRNDVSLTSMTDEVVIEQVRIALTEHGQRRVEMPAKTAIHPRPEALMHAMPAWLPAAQACGIKWVSCFPDNAEHQLPQTGGLVVLNCPDSGWPICVMDAAWITAKRTAAVTALACEHLARSDTTELGIIGAGVQGRAHAHMLPLVLPALERIKVTDNGSGSAHRMVVDLQAELAVPIVACDSIEQVVSDSGVVVSATKILPLPEPRVRDAWVAPGAFIAPVDFNSMWEGATFSRADKFVVDDLEGIHHFMKLGYFTGGLPEIHSELGEVVAALKPGRQHDAELIVDMNLGMGVEDMAVAIEIYRRARDQGIGRVLPL